MSTTTETSSNTDKYLQLNSLSSVWLFSLLLITDKLPFSIEWNKTKSIGTISFNMFKHRQRLFITIVGYFDENVKWYQ